MRFKVQERTIAYEFKQPNEVTSLDEVLEKAGVKPLPDEKMYIIYVGDDGKIYSTRIPTVLSMHKPRMDRDLALVLTNDDCPDNDPGVIKKAVDLYYLLTGRKKPVRS